VIDNSPPNPPDYVLASAPYYSPVSMRWSRAFDPQSGIDYFNVYQVTNGVYVKILSSLLYESLVEYLKELTEYSFAVSSVNGAGLESPYSEIEPVTTPADTSSPIITRAVAGKDPTKIYIHFNEPLNSQTAETISNYALSNGVSVVYAEYDPAKNVVTLTVSGLAVQTSYTLTAGNIADMATTPNTIVSPLSADFTFTENPVLISGYEIISPNERSKFTPTGTRNLSQIIRYLPGIRIQSADYAIYGFRILAFLWKHR
jgi:hypothetical protein